MFTRSPKLLLTCLAIVGALTLTAGAQSLNNESLLEADEIRAVIDNSIKTATFENGKLRSFHVQLPNGYEKVITVEQSDDKRSFSMFDDGRKITVQHEEDGRISSVVFPDGRQASFKWILMPNGYWVPAEIKVDGKDLRRSDFEDGVNCAAICRNAAVATTIAIGTCIANGPATPACWAATATAAYATYLCYECTYPQNQLARTNEIILLPPDSRLALWKRKKSNCSTGS